jgi:glutaconyl-CoA decarboxylase
MSEYVLRIGGREYRAEVREITPEHATVAVDGKDYRVDLVQLGRRPAAPDAVQRAVSAAAVASVPAAASPLAPAPHRAAAGADAGAITAPMPGLVLSIKVKEAEKVQAGQVLLVMEAMKMENAIQAPFTGTVSRVLVREGDSIGEGDRLIELARPKLTAL